MNIQRSETRIPKIIHYCWFGGNPLPPQLKECVDSWKKLDGYQIIEWNESNCSFDENEFVRRAYKERKFAFISDFYRLKGIYEYGGIYLDTDVKVFRDFDPLLNYPVFLNFIFDCAVGSAVIGAEPKSQFIKNLLQMYEDTVFVQKNDNTNGNIFDQRDGNLYVNEFVTNNYYFTYYILKHYPHFKLNNKFQNLGDFVIYPKEYFEIGSLLNRQYTIHYCAGVWRVKNDSRKTLKNSIKRILMKNPWIYEKTQILIRKRRYLKLNKKIPFYAYSLAQKKGENLPEL